ncbi:MAG: hypothetical protein ACP5VS_17640, partial [Desulfomonilaceae bacterium]
MLPVLNRPILEWHIMNCVRNGIKIIHIIAVENPLAVGEFVHPDTRWGASIEMLVYKDPCGVRELLTRISGLVQDKVLIIPAEILINVEYQYLVNLHHSKTTITKVLTDGCVDFHSNKQSHNCYKKLSPVSIETGIYIVDKGALNSSEEIAYSWDGSFVSIQTPRDLWIANMTALMGCFDNFLGSDYRRPSNNEPEIGHHTYTDSTVVLKTPCLIGDHCKINSGVSVSKFSVIGNGVIIDHGATIESSVIFKDTYVGTDTSIENCLVSGNVMMNLDIGSWTSVDDQFLLSGVKKRLEYSFSEKLFDKSLALLLLIATSPVWTIKGFIRVIGRKSFFAVRQFMVRDVYF